MINLFLNLSIAERRMHIFNMLRTDKKVQVSQLAEKFQVSPVTIRRDLAIFEKQGLINTDYGYAYLKADVGVHPMIQDFTSKSILNKNMSTTIAAKASEFIHENDTVIIESGCINLELTKFLQSKKLTIITNSWPIAQHFSGNTKVKLILAPGTYNAGIAGTLDEMTIDFFKQYYVNKVFLETEGLDIKTGATVEETLHGNLKKTLLKAGEEKFLLIEKEKIKKRHMVKHANCTDFDYIISNCRNELDDLKKNNAKTQFIFANNDRIS